jgi:hypothetical protein
MQVSCRSFNSQSSQSNLRDFVPPKSANSLHIASLGSLGNKAKLIEGGAEHEGNLRRAGRP